MPGTGTWAPQSRKRQLLGHPHEPCKALISLRGAQRLPVGETSLSLVHCCGPRCLAGAWQKNRCIRPQSPIASILESKLSPWPPRGDQPSCRSRFRAHLPGCRGAPGAAKPHGSAVEALRPQVGADALLIGDPSKRQWGLKGCNAGDPREAGLRAQQVPALCGSLLTANGPAQL